MKVKNVSLKANQIAMGQFLYFAEPQTGVIQGIVVGIRRVEDVVAHAVSVGHEEGFPASADPSVHFQHPHANTSDWDAIEKEMKRNPEYAEYVNRVMAKSKGNYFAGNNGVLTNYHTVGERYLDKFCADKPSSYVFLFPIRVKDTVFKVQRPDGTTFEIGANALNREEFATRVFRKAKHAKEYAKRPVLIINGTPALETNFITRVVEEANDAIAQESAS